jgi:ankyrin repeat protein
MISQRLVPTKNGRFSIMPTDGFSTTMLFFTPKEIAKLPLVSSRWKEMTEQGEQDYWRQQCLYIGLNVKALRAAEEEHLRTEESKQKDNMHESQSFLRYKDLYKPFNQLASTERHRVREPWELYCLSGRPHLIFEKITETSNDIGASALHYTALGGSLDALKCVLKIKGLEPLARDNYGRTLLHYAAWGGSIKVLNYVLTLRGMDRLAKTYNGTNLLHYAARSGSLDMIHHVLFMEKGYVSRLIYTLKNTNLLAENARVLLSPIVESGSVNILNRLLKENLDFLSWHNKKTLMTVFHDAAKSGSVNMLNQLLEKIDKAMSNDQLYRMNPHKRNKYITLKNFPLKEDCRKITTLHYAALSGSVAVFERALKIKGVQLQQNLLGKITLCFPEINPLARTSLGKTILHCAAQSGSVAIFERILKIKEINPLESDSEGFTVLHHAAMSGSVPLFEYVLGMPGIDPLGLDHKGRTVLHHATWSGSISLFKYVLSIPGINPLHQDNDAHNVLFSTVLNKWCSIDILKCILEIEGINLSARDNNNMTVLHYAALTDSTECILYLYAHHHKFNFDFASFINGIDISNSSGSDDMKKILLLIKDDIRGIDSKKADFFAKILPLVCAVLILMFLIVSVVLIHISPIMSLISLFPASLGAIVGNCERIQENIRHIDNRSRFAWFFRPPSNPFEQYNYRRNFFSSPVIAAAEESQPAVPALV